MRLLRRFHSHLSSKWNIYDDMSTTQYSKLECMLQSALGVKSSSNQLNLVVSGSHLVYFNHTVPENELGKDGYDNIQAPTPQLKPEEVLVRRWMGGTITFGKDKLMLNKPAVCTETLAGPIDITSRSRKWDVYIDRYMKNVDSDQQFSVYEQRQFFYFIASSRTLKLIAQRTKPEKDAIPDPIFTHTLKVTPVLLFRYSALTFNAHLVHYNSAYTEGVEQLPDLLVQGPLLVTLVLRWVDECAKQMGKSIKSFRYQNLAPLLVNSTITLTLCQSQNETKAQVLLNGKVAFDSSLELETPR